MFKYYQLVGDIDGETEVLFGSYVKNEVKFELNAERKSLKANGYYHLQIVTVEVEQAPDKDVYPELYEV